jgi:hypothetical protein
VQEHLLQTLSDTLGMAIEIEPFGGIVVRFVTLELMLQVDPCGAHAVWHGKVIRRVLVGQA